MDIRLSYGKEGIDVTLPSELTTVGSPEFIQALPDQQGAIKYALRNQIDRSALKASVKSGEKVAISICDVTRPMPRHIVLPVILSELLDIFFNFVIYSLPIVLKLSLSKFTILSIDKLVSSL